MSDIEVPVTVVTSMNFALPVRQLWQSLLFYEQIVEPPLCVSCCRGRFAPRGINRPSVMRRFVCTRGGI